LEDKRSTPTARVHHASGNPGCRPTPSLGGAKASLGSPEKAERSSFAVGPEVRGLEAPRRKTRSSLSSPSSRGVGAETPGRRKAHKIADETSDVKAWLGGQVPPWTGQTSDLRNPRKRGRGRVRKRTPSAWKPQGSPY